MLRVATYNIHHGADIQGVVNLERIASTIIGLEAEFIALQELDRNVRRSGNVDQPARLQELTGMHVAFYPTARVGGGEFGIGVAMTNPSDTSFRLLPATPFDRRHGAIVSDVRGVTVVATHLSRKPHARAFELPSLLSACRRLGSPKVLLGDFNMSAAELIPLRMAGVRKVDRHRPTFPSTGPSRQPDHVLVSSGVSILASRAVRSDASDHLPLVAEIQVGTA